MDALLEGAPVVPAAWQLLALSAGWSGTVNCDPSFLFALHYHAEGAAVAWKIRVIMGMRVVLDAIGS